TTVVYVSFQCASACLSEDRVASLTGVWSSAYSVLRKGALAPCLIAVLAISSSSVDTRTRLKHPLCSAASMDHAMSGLPNKSTTSFRGIRWDPPRAGMMAMRCSTTGTAPEKRWPEARSVLGFAGFDEGDHFFVEGDRRPDGLRPYAVNEVLQGCPEGGKGVL